VFLENIAPHSGHGYSNGAGGWGGYGIPFTPAGQSLVADLLRRPWSTVGAGVGAILENLEKNTQIK